MLTWARSIPAEAGQKSRGGLRAPTQESSTVGPVSRRPPNNVLFDVMYTVVDRIRRVRRLGNLTANAAKRLGKDRDLFLVERA